MRFPPDVLEEIRARMPVSAVVGRRIKLKKQGREWVGLSPFNKEKSPSFYVNDQKNFYHDFSSGKHGDIFTFLMETEGLSFPEAVERLAQDAGVRLPEKSDAPEDREIREKRAGAIEALEMTARWYEERLAAPVGREARAYLEKRGLSAETLSTFRMGYAPGGRTALKEYLVQQGVSPAIGVEAGLLIAPDDGGEAYDRFRDRVMIPIQDGRGRIVGFGGRALQPDAKPKYLNSPETPLFQKSQLLFNAHRAREAAHAEKRLVLVEGYMDAIALWQAGMKPVVAALGTAFNENHVENAWRLAPEPVICFDGDRAGVGAAHRAIDRIMPVLKEGRSFWYAFVPDGQDPDDFVRARGLEAFRQLIQQASPIVDVLWNRELGRWPIDTPERMAGLETRLRQTVAEIKDPNVRRHYEQHFKIRLSSFFWKLERDRWREKAKTGTGQQRITGPAPGLQRRHALERTLLGLLIEHPREAERRAENLGASCALSDDLEAMKFELLRIATDGEAEDADDVCRRVDPAFLEELDLTYGHADDLKGLQRGHRLRERLPILRLDPPPDFIGRLIDLLIAMVQLKRTEEDLALAKDEYARVFDIPSENRFLALVRDREAWADQVRALETPLDEEARALRGFADAGTRISETIAA